MSAFLKLLIFSMSILVCIQGKISIFAWLILSPEILYKLVYMKCIFSPSKARTLLEISKESRSAILAKRITVYHLNCRFCNFFCDKITGLVRHRLFRRFKTFGYQNFHEVLVVISKHRI